MTHWLEVIVEYEKLQAEARRSGIQIFRVKQQQQSGQKMRCRLCGQMKSIFGWHFGKSSVCGDCKPFMTGPLMF